MTLRVFIPLHTDETLPGGATATPRVERMADAAGELLAQALATSSAAAWPELRMININCWLVDRDETRDKDARFDRKYGMWSVALSLDAAVLLPLPEAQRAATILRASLQTLQGAFERKSLPVLGQITAGVADQLTPVFLAELEKSQEAGVDDVGAQATVEYPRDPDGRVRHVNELPRRRGELWVMLAMPGTGDAVSADDVLDQIESHVSDSGLGKTDGRSIGKGAFDVSFVVKNLAAAGASVEEFLRRKYPGLDYVISDDFEVVFER